MTKFITKNGVSITFNNNMIRIRKDSPSLFEFKDDNLIAVNLDGYQIKPIDDRLVVKRDAYNFFCKKELKIPNPMWWIVGYLIIYPSKLIISKYLKLFQPYQENYTCDNCGTNLQGSFFPWCSIECLNELSNT